MRRAEPSYSAGVAASVAAEGVFIAMVAGVALARGKDPWMVARVPASFLLGPAAVRPKGVVVGLVYRHLLEMNAGSSGSYGASA